MNINVDQVLGWLIVAALAGAVAGLLVTRKREGFGRFQNLLIGAVGTLVGVGTIYLLKKFEVLKQDIIPGGVVIRWQELAASCLGALLFLGVLRLLRKKK